MRRWLLLTLVTSLVCMTSSQCPDGETLPVWDAYQAADNVLLGRDVTVMPDCPGDIGNCPRRQIMFQVLCVLKQTQDLDFLDFSQPVTIGVNRSVSFCDRTYFAHGSTATMVVLVTVRRDNNATYLDWQEANNATRGHYLYGDDLTQQLGLSCDLTTAYDPAQDACAIDGSDCCSARCKFATTTMSPTTRSPGDRGPVEPPTGNNIRAHFHLNADNDVGVHCCKHLKAGSVDRWISDAENGGQVPAYALSKEPVVQISPAVPFTQGSERLAATLYTRDSTIQVLWMVINAPAYTQDDMYLHLDFSTPAITVFDLLPVLPSSMAGQELRLAVFRHSLLDRSHNVVTSLYLNSSDCASDSLFVYRCSFDLGKFMNDYSMELIDDARVTVTPDDWSVYTAIMQHDASPREACPLVSTNLVPYKNTVLCPAAERYTATGGATRHTSALLLLLVVVSCILSAFH